MLLKRTFHRKLNDNGLTVSRIFTKSTSVLSHSGIPLSLHPPLKYNSKREEKERGAKETEVTSKIRGKWNTASRSFYKAIRARVVHLETMLGINPIGIDLMIGDLPLYACSSELSLDAATAATRLSIIDHERERCVRPPILFDPHCISNQPKRPMRKSRVQQYRQCRFKLSAVIGSLADS